MNTGILVGVIVVFCLVGVSTASAGIIYVPDNFSKIQWAVDNATAGDTIIVRDGTYYEKLEVDKRLILKSENGSASCIVDAGGSGSAITLSADEITVEGFTATNSGSYWGDSGIEVVSNANNITNNNVLNNYDGISLWEASDNNITNNDISLNNYDGIHLDYSNNSIITGNNLSLNKEDGINLYFSNNSIITNNNVSSNFRHGIFLYESKYNNISNNDISSNKGDGIYLSESKYNNISNNDISSNKGDGIYSDYSNNSIITGNNLSLNTDDGIHLSYSNNSIITGNNLSLNTDNGIVLSRSDNSIITNNNVSSNYRCVYLYSSSYIEVYLNNFINESNDVYSYLSITIWNSTDQINYIHNGSTFTNYLGNYWSDYTGSDSDGDGIGDTPYSISENNDDYPLIQPFERYFPGQSYGDFNGDCYIDFFDFMEFAAVYNTNCSSPNYNQLADFDDDCDVDFFDFMEFAAVYNSNVC